MATETPTNVHTFDDHTRVELDGTGRGRAQVAPGWEIAGVPNGGYLASLVLRAAVDSAGEGQPLVLSVAYLRRAAVGACDLEVSQVHEGGTHTVREVALRQGGVDVVRARTTSTTRDRSGEPLYLRAQPPVLPPPEQCLAPDQALVGGFPPPPIMDRVDVRLPEAYAGFGRGRPSGTAEVAGWVRFADGRPPDALSLPLFADVLPPAVFNAGLPLGWVPTLDFTVHLLREPTPGWLRAAFRTRSVAGGYLEEDGELWDASGRLVAMSRQLALAPAAPARGREADDAT